MVKMTRKETQVSLVRNLFIGIKCFTADRENDKKKGDILSLGGLSSGCKPTSAGGAMEDYHQIDNYYCYQIINSYYHQIIIKTNNATPT